ncbi:MAG: CPBP family intramembrane metalloprotease [Planctomycetes bacterium]|nr:CPBP family intramembrane metalloprotease [Planctomycetota bacterium]
MFCGLWLGKTLGVLVALKTGLGFPGMHGAKYEPELGWILAVSTLSAVLVEEVFFRAYLWSRLTELSRRPTLSLAVAGLAWTSVHFYTLPSGVGLLLGGWLLGWLFMERRSLWALVLGHWAFNLSLYYHWFG